MEERIAKGFTICIHCLHPGISHAWLEEDLHGPMESVGCTVLYDGPLSKCQCPGFNGQLVQKRLI